MLLTLLTEEDVDLRPRRPDGRRYVEERGVTGEGDREVRRLRTVLSGIAEYRREDVGVNVAP